MDVLVDLIERHAKTVPALKQEMMRLVGNDKTVITEIKRAIKKLAAVRPNTRSRPKEIQTQLVSVLELIKHLSLRRPHEALPLLCLLLEDASNVAGSFSQTSVVAAFFRDTLPSAGADVLARCSDLDLVRHEVGQVMLKDRYRTKAWFLQGVGDALPEDLVDELRRAFAARIKHHTSPWDDLEDEAILLLKALEFSVGDVVGYEKAARRQGMLHRSDGIALAQMCIGHEDYAAANVWLDKIPNDVDNPAARAMNKQRDALYLQIATATGSTAHAALAFRSHMLTQPSTETIAMLRTLLGDDGAMNAVREAALQLVAKDDPSPRVMTFFVQNGYDDVMEERMFAPLVRDAMAFHHEWQLVEAFIDKMRFHGALQACRHFITDILTDSYFTMYGEAIYAMQLQRALARDRKDLRGLQTADAFESELRLAFNNETSFWRDLDVASTRRFPGSPLL